MIEGIRRTLIGSILHLAGTIYFFFYPTLLFVMLMVDQERVPDFLASYSWITYLNFSLMFVFAAVLGFGLMAPLKRAVRRITAGVFILSAVVNLGSITFVFAHIGQLLDVVSTSLNSLFCISIGVGLILGYDSKAAPFLLPFRRDGVEEELGSIGA
jgi:hypothetical protein